MQSSLNAFGGEEIARGNAVALIWEGIGRGLRSSQDLPCTSEGRHFHDGTFTDENVRLLLLTP